MRTVAISMLAIFMTFSIATAAGPDCGDDWKNKHKVYKFDGDFHDCHYHHNNRIRLDIDDDEVIITCERRRYRSDEVKITGNYRLYVNGDRVDVDDDQKELLKKFYHKAIDLNEEARLIGREGAEIGVEGARIGAHAVAGVMKLLLLDFDEDEFEESIEWEAERLEEKAEKLEERAEALEEMAEDLEDMHDDLGRKIPELRELRWF